MCDQRVAARVGKGQRERERERERERPASRSHPRHALSASRIPPTNTLPPSLTPPASRDPRAGPSGSPQLPDNLAPVGLHVGRDQKKEAEQYPHHTHA